MKSFLVDLEDLQPSQLYISAGKLDVMRAAISHHGFAEPLPVKHLGEELVLTDGHTRAFAAFESGQKCVPVVWDMDELDWEAYEICVCWCKEEGIRTIADLAGRVVNDEVYQRMWLDRCREMHHHLARKRGRG